MINRNIEEKKVIVIGAGIAGITAAQRLEELGYKVILLEAQHDVGGRTRLSHNVSLGPMFVHEEGSYQGEGGIEGYIQLYPDYLLTMTDLPSIQPISALLKKYNISNMSKNNNSDLTSDAIVVGEQTKNFNLLDCKTWFEKYRAQYQNHYVELPKGNDNSLENHFAKALITTFEEAYSGLSIEELTQIMQNTKERGIEFFKYGDLDLWVENKGYYNLIQAMQKELKNTDIHLNAIVKKIELNSRKVIVTTTSGEKFTALAVIPTLSLGVLKKGEVEIENLSETKKLAIKNLKMGVMNKVILKFEKQFWDLKKFHFIILNTTPGSRPVTLLLTLNEVSAEGSYTLIGSFFANDAMRDKKALIEDTKNAIKEAWPDAPAPILEEASDWHLDPYTYGSYASFSKDTSHQDIVDIMAPEWDGKLVFAGDGVIPIGLMGCFHGAYISALRAARLIDEHLKNNLSSLEE